MLVRAPWWLVRGPGRQLWAPWFSVIGPGAPWLLLILLLITVMCVITEKKKLQLNIARICCHNFFVVSGILIGGAPGPLAPLATPMSLTSFVISSQGKSSVFGDATHPEEMLSKLSQSLLKKLINDSIVDVTDCTIYSCQIIDEGLQYFEL